MANEYNSTDAVSYWNKMRLGEGFSCPNVSFFRFLGSCGVDIRDKLVLEIGFGANRGKDLLECQTRGAMAFGADISESYIDDFKKRHPEVPVTLMDAGKDQFPFDLNFDLIFHRDMIYYLSDSEIKFHFKNSHQNLCMGGYLVFQFIENDIFVGRPYNTENSYAFNVDVLRYGESNKMLCGEVNPLRTLNIDWLIAEAKKSGFNLCGTKTCIESYAPDESVYRIDRYLLLKK